MTQDSKGEIILNIGVEGGGLTLYGRRLDQERWEFSMHSGGMNMDENDNEYWEYHDYGPVTTWDEALTLLGDASRWVRYYPSHIHPEFLDRVQAIVEQHAANLSPRQRENWQRAFAESRSRRSS